MVPQPREAMNELTNMASVIFRSHAPGPAILQGSCPLTPYHSPVAERGNRNRLPESFGVFLWEVGLVPDPRSVIHVHSVPLLLRSPTMTKVIRQRESL